MRRFSALQRAENSSIEQQQMPCLRTGQFQCSSASRKFLNTAGVGRNDGTCEVSVLFSEPKIPQSLLVRSSRSQLVRSFSALQRAENSSMNRRPARVFYRARFSALQRAENSSIWRRRRSATIGYCVSVLFSEPKIPQ